MTAILTRINGSESLSEERMTARRGFTSRICLPHEELPGDVLPGESALSANGSQEGYCRESLR